jgi:hypothetical protein
MDLHEALYTTRAMRRLKPDPVPMDVQARILDAAIRAPNIGQQWRFILVDDREVIGRLAPLYEQAFERLLSGYGMSIDALLNAEGDIGRVARSGVHLARNFGDVPLVLFAFGKAGESSGVHPAVWTGVLQSFFADEINEILGVPTDEEWRCFGVVPMGYPVGRWGIAPRAPVHTVAFRNSWTGDLGFTVDEPLWRPTALD